MVQGFVTVITGVMMSVPIRFLVKLIMTMVMIPSRYFTRQLSQAMGRCFADRRE
jgi:cytochrome b subunit of formate dehydrogenase